MTAHRTLLAEYAVNGSEEAFREVVTRYLNLVYSTAVRLVNGDTHLAEDVAQTVFADLARLAATLSQDVMLGGWLHRRTCHVALSLMRSQRRRQNRERQAAEMNIQQDHTEASFEQIAPVLDEAINQLGKEDRAAITLRFFEGRDFRAIGEALGSNADAAQKRVTRALEKLRGLLGRRGVTASSAVLATALAAHAVTAAPAGLAVNVSTAALASAATSGGVTLTLLKLMAMTHLKVAVGAVVVAGLGTTLVLEHQALTKVREQNYVLQQQVEQLAGQTEPVSTRRMLKPRLPAPRLPVAAPAAEPVAETLRPTNLIARLLNGDDLYKLNLQQVESFLQGSRRSAESLLAAFRATEDPALLQEALEKHPNDPRVRFAAYFAAMRMPELPPEERRQRLEAFKQSAPDNALANYLSAQDYFNSGQTDQAVQELVAASGKSQFQDYSGDFVQNAEEAYRAAGYSEAEAKAIASCSLPLPQLAQLRRLGENVAELATLYRKAGDEASAQAALQIGLNLAQRASEPSGNHYLINDLVGLNIESHILESIDPGSFYDNAGHTVKDRLDDLTQRREKIKRLGEPAAWLGGERRDVLVTLSERMPPQDLISFFDRLKVSGEREALRWALNKLSPQK
jgi:RNA polymerase sigma factor (sigma-70 family)